MTVEFNSDPNRAYDYAEGHPARMPFQRGLEHCESFEEDPCDSDPDAAVWSHGEHDTEVAPTAPSKFALQGQVRSPGPLPPPSDIPPRPPPMPSTVAEVERLRVEVDYYKPIAQEYLRRAPEIGRRFKEADEAQRTIEELRDQLAAASGRLPSRTRKVDRRQ